jgi:hypothetical protein
MDTREALVVSIEPNRESSFGIMLDGATKQG